MHPLIEQYRQKLSLSSHAKFKRIEHEEAMVALVFLVSEEGHPDRILKVCSRAGDFLREAYFLRRFSGKMAVPEILQLVEPEEHCPGAVFMQCLSGTYGELEARNAQQGGYRRTPSSARVHPAMQTLFRECIEHFAAVFLICLAGPRDL